MKFSVSRDVFLKTLQKIQSVIPTHAAQPILYNILLACEKNILTVTATDSNMTMRCELVADVKRKGQSTVSGRYLIGIMREFSQEDVDVEVDDKDIFQIRCGASTCKIFGITAESFPKMAAFENENGVDIDRSVFRDMLRKTVYAASVEDTRRILNGVLISMKDQKITVVATDGRRLALVEHEAEIGPAAERDVILPLKAVVELVKSLEGDGSLKVQLEPKKAGFDIEGVKLVSNLLEGEYPNYRQVIPNQYEERLVVERESFLAALRRAALFTDPRSPRVKVMCGDNQMKISAITPDVGEANESVPIKYSGKSITAAFNPEFLMDPLRSLSDDEIVMELMDEISPLVIKSSVPFLYVLMPLRGD